MWLRILILSVVGACLVLGTAPESSHAKDRQTVKSKKKKKKKSSKRTSAKKSKRKSNDDAATALGEDVKTAANPYANGDAEDFSAEDEELKGVLSEGTTGEGALRRSNRMEFDERLVKGQAAKSGAVYLFKRVPRRLPGLVPMRRSYRRRIVEPVLGVRELKPATYSKKKDSPSGDGDRKDSYVSTAPQSAVDKGAGSLNSALSSENKKETGKPGGDK
ncbi:MAG: hypothetical protein GY762_09045 [Proteobacteria bacterium]|nr:hypothetical protein [Pseudomonadota bacterium]